MSMAQTFTAHTRALSRSTRTVIGDIVSGFSELVHNGFALFGLAVALTLVLIGSRADLRADGEIKLMNWLQDRHMTRAGMADVQVEPDAVDRATAVDVADLPKQQALVAKWIARKYNVAPEPIGALVAEAYDVGKETKIDPLLILAIMATESSFNPYAQSPVGAQGLMQVMTHIHKDKYEHFGGKLAAFDPVTNLRVGVKVLQECIQRAGSLEAGLKYYVGAAFHDNDGGYGAKVLSERARLAEVAAGRAIPTFNAPTATAPAPMKASATANEASIKPTQAIQPAIDQVPGVSATPAVEPRPVTEPVAMNS